MPSTPDARNAGRRPETGDHPPSSGGFPTPRGGGAGTPARPALVGVWEGVGLGRWRCGDERGVAMGVGTAAGFDTGVLVGWVRGDLEEAVPFDWLCVGVTDPSTGLVTMVQACTPIGPPEVY